LTEASTIISINPCKHGHTGGRYRWGYCKECLAAEKAGVRAANKAARYAANKDKKAMDRLKAANKKLKAELRLQLKLRAIEYKGGICCDCKNIFHPSAMDFHHIDPSQKEHQPSKLFYGKWVRITYELDKCVLLCSNCHRLRHSTNAT